MATRERTGGGGSGTMAHATVHTHTHSGGSGGAEGRLIDKRSDRQPTHSINSSLGADHDDDDDEEHDEVKTALGRAGQGRAGQQYESKTTTARQQIDILYRKSDFPIRSLCTISGNAFRKCCFFCFYWLLMTCGNKN